MDNQPQEQLPIGRVALARTITAEWVTEHSRTILIGLMSLILLAFFLFQVSGKLSTGKKSDYLEVQRAFTAWTAEEKQDPKLFAGLEKPLSRHPELEAKFGTHIAQRLLSLGDVRKAGQYATAALKRSHALTSSYYERFSRNTLAISQGKYPEALEEAKQMKAELEKDGAFWEKRDKLVHSGTLLYAYNLLRIAALERETGSKEGELKAWEELVSHAGWKGAPANPMTYDREAYSMLAQNFSEGDLTLLDFIEQRKKELIH